MRHPHAACGCVAAVFWIYVAAVLAWWLIETWAG